MKPLNAQYWDEQYLTGKTGWDMGYASPPIVNYFLQLERKNLKILIPGAGNAWEAEWLWKNGFEQVYIMEISKIAIEKFKRRVPDFPSSQILNEDFFQHQGTYDIIVEQTFFSSLPVELRFDYAKKVHSLLNEGGKLMGLLFNHQFAFQGPPFGGTPEEYEQLFRSFFHFKIFENATNSIKPRQGRELFLVLIKLRWFD